MMRTDSAESQVLAVADTVSPKVIVVEPRIIGSIRTHTDTMSFRHAFVSVLGAQCLLARGSSD